MEYTLSELKKKEVINVADGKKLGKISDLEITFPIAKVKYFIISPAMNFFCCDQIKISPNEIVRIGEDTVLVKFKCESKKGDECHCDYHCEGEDE